MSLASEYRFKTLLGCLNGGRQNLIMATVDFAALGKTKLAPVIHGEIAGSFIDAEFLWSQGPAAFFVIRRAGCELCREDALEISNMFAKSKLKGIHLFGIIKEVAPIVGALTDEELGVNEFQYEYFNQYPVFIDKEKKFYAYFGNKSVLDQKWFTWNPFKLFSAYGALKARLLGKNIKGNLKGEGLLKGGFLIVHPTRGVVYRHEEVTGDEMPYVEIFAALKAAVKPPPERKSIFWFRQSKPDSSSERTTATTVEEEEEPDEFVPRESLSNVRCPSVACSLP